MTTPLVTIVDPFTPDLEAVHVLRTEPAVKTPASMFFTDAELVTEVFPLVLTTTGPVGPVSVPGYRPPRMMAGPYWAMTPSSSAAATAMVDPPGGRATSGLELRALPGGTVCPHPRRSGGP